MERPEKNRLKRIAVIGATGQVGTALCRELCLAFPDTKIIACARKSHSSPNAAFPNYHPFILDPAQEDWSSLGRIDFLVNAIGIIEEQKSFAFMDAHLGVTEKILRHRDEIGNPGIIQISALGADVMSDSPFLHTKALADELLIREERTWVVRPSIVCTHDTLMVQKLRMIRKIAKYCFNRILLPSRFGRTRMQPILGEDLGAIVCAICSHPLSRQIIPATGPEIFTLGELIRTGKPGIRIIPFPQRVFDFFFRNFYFLFSRLLNKEHFRMLGTDNTFDPTPGETILGRKMRSTLDFWKSELTS